MKSYLFTTDNDRGGVMLCDIDEFDEAVEYLCNRFAGVVRIEAGEEVWVKDSLSEVEDKASADRLPESQPDQVAEPDLFS